jgi:hypothetical protein
MNTFLLFSLFLLGITPESIICDESRNYISNMLQNLLETAGHPTEVPKKVY